jgi:hypothetical protein
MKRTTINPVDGIDIKLGDVFLIGARLYRVERFTPTRAYVEPIQGIVLRHEKSISIGVQISGGDQSEGYIDVGWAPEVMKQRIAESIRLPRGLSDEEIIGRGAAAWQAAKSHSKRIAELRALLTTEQEAERAAIVAELLRKGM